jgi:hypothetical protein
VNGLEAQLSRRRFLRAGGVLAGAIGAASVGWPLTIAPATAAPPVRRCVTLGADGVINPGGAQDYRANRRLMTETGTRWVRLWADWPSLQPEAGLSPDKGSGAWRLRELDSQIAQANADGVAVILTAYRFPRWANGAAGLGQVPGGKDPRFGLPADLSATGPWGRWIDFLLSRYGSSGAPTAAFLEVCNEPNLQMWPQRAPDGSLTIHRAVAAMFRTAQRLASERPEAPMLLGPATSDGLLESDEATAYDAFTDALLDELASTGFHAGPRFAWSHHNFTDVEYDRGPGSTTGRAESGAATTREMLRGRWDGWPAADRSAPQILISEGGARVTKIAAIYGRSEPAAALAKQAELIKRSWDRSGGGATGIAMFGQYLFDTDARYDSGLRELDGRSRPALATWAALPSHR